HAITGKVPPSAFDRMLDDAYEPLGKKALAGFSPGVLVGLDAGLSVRASDRPQTIAGWRAILGQASAFDAAATVALARQGDGATALASRPTAAVAAEAAAPAKGRGVGLWIASAAAALLLLAGGGY